MYLVVFFRDSGLGYKREEVERDREKGGGTESEKERGGKRGRNMF